VSKCMKCGSQEVSRCMKCGSQEVSILLLKPTSGATKYWSY